ncbi:arginine repressor [Lacticaseibacillus paracasei]|uniref:arginine repressor n=1 Tax=Lacticaseibacillus paracasei TaxID=1597 RepID=UPI004045FFF9
MNKSERQAALTRIINQKPIATQEELLAALKAAGIDATQATISRDIREMKIVKSQDATGTLRYTIFRGSSESQLERLGRSIREVGLSITRVHFMNVIKTLPSNGNLLAAIIDDIGFEQVVGTIAGHDTIVVISPDEKQAKWFEAAYRQDFNS